MRNKKCPDFFSPHTLSTIESRHLIDIEFLTRKKNIVDIIYPQFIPIYVAREKIAHFF